RYRTSPLASTETEAETRGSPVSETQRLRGGEHGPPEDPVRVARSVDDRRLRRRVEGQPGRAGARGPGREPARGDLPRRARAGAGRDRGRPGRARVAGLRPALLRAARLRDEGRGRDRQPVPADAAVAPAARGAGCDRG